MPLVAKARFSLISWCACALLLACSPVAAATDAEISAAYQRFYGGDADGAFADFERLIASDPKGLPSRFGLLTVRKSQADADRALEDDFERRIDVLINDAEARYGRSKQDDEALFYLGNAYILRAVYRVDHDKGTWGAARDGARAKGLADTYIKRHPEHGDAYFMLGTYNYYSEIAPSFIKFLRPLLFLPAGDRAGGIRQLERAYAQGNFFAAQAGMRLVDIYGSLEGRPSDGVRIGEQLARKYPDNSAIRFQLANLYLGPAVEDPAKAAAQYDVVIAAESRRSTPRPALYQAQFALASARAEDWRLDEAIRLLTSTIDARPATPPAPEWVMPVSLLQRAVFRSTLDDEHAIDDVKRVLGEPKWKAHHKNADSLLKELTARRASGQTAVSAALIPGNRLVAEQRWSDAAASYEPVKQRWPNDPQVRFRLASLQFARGDAAGAAPAAAALAKDRNTPARIRAASLLVTARAEDLAGRRESAKKIYNQIIDGYEEDNAAWSARVGLVTPYRRPER